MSKKKKQQKRKRNETKDETAKQKYEKHGKFMEKQRRNGRTSNWQRKKMSTKQMLSR